jgi:hypothetical protein
VPKKIIHILLKSASIIFSTEVASKKMESNEKSIITQTVFNTIPVHYRDLNTLVPHLVNNEALIKCKIV